MTSQAVDRGLVAATAAKQGLELDSQALDRLAAFGNLFLQWNERINLGGRIGPSELVQRHFADAFAAQRFVAGENRVVDVGTGGGLPAVPLAVVCVKVNIDLWEPTAKKVAFLRTAVRSLQLGERVVVNAGRMDADGAAGPPGNYDLAMSRATFAPLDWLELGRRLVRPGGKVLVFATDDSPASGAEPEVSYPYGENRQILIFAAGGSGSS